jgi:hypothetical protein
LLSRVISKIHDAGEAPEAWPEALQSLTGALGVAGAACIVRNNTTGGIDWVCFSGLGAALESDYIDHYAPLDPFLPLLGVDVGWMKLSERLPECFLRKSEWYNDFVLECGVRDILGIRLVDAPTHSVIFGVHQQIGRSFGDKAELILAKVTDPLSTTALRHMENRFGAMRDESSGEVLGNGARYYFHLGNGSRQYPDEAGEVFSGSEAAIAHAAKLASELRQDEHWDGFVILVTNQHRTAIAQVPVQA